MIGAASLSTMAPLAMLTSVPFCHARALVPHSEFPSWTYMPTLDLCVRLSFLNLYTDP